MDEIARLPVRLAEIAGLAANLWPLDFAAPRANRRLVAFALACLALPLLQLVPLPPDVWAGLPGHSVYAEIARATATVGWRPLSLAPDLTVNAAQALVVPIAAGAATLYLDRDGRKVGAAAFALLALASAILGLAQLGVSGDLLRLYRHTSENAPVGLFANRNHQAALLACAFPLGAARLPARIARRAPWLALSLLAPAAILLSAVLFLTGSRMGLLLWIGGLLGAAWVLHTRGLLHRPQGAAALAGWSLAGGLALAVVAAAVLFDGELVHRFRARDFAADTRWIALPSLLATARAFFPTGAGFGSFDSVYRQFEPDALLSTIYLNQAHNEPLQLAIEGGFPAIALLLAFVVWWTRISARLLRRGGASPKRGLPRAAAVVTALLMISSLVDYPLRTPLLASLFAFCCVEMALADRRRDDRGEGA